MVPSVRVDPFGLDPDKRALLVRSVDELIEESKSINLDDGKSVVQWGNNLKDRFRHRLEVRGARYLKLYRVLTSPP